MGLAAHIGAATTVAGVKETSTLSSKPWDGGGACISTHVDPGKRTGILL